MIDDPKEELDREKLVHEPLDSREALRLVRLGTDADLRRALILARSNVLSIGAVRSALVLRAQEALRFQALPADRVESLKVALAGLLEGEEVEFPFYPEQGLVTVTVPFQARF